MQHAERSHEGQLYEEQTYKDVGSQILFGL
jgi:hypothetical protein